MLVTDASAWLGAAFPQQDSDYPRAVAAGVNRSGGLVPQIFWFEVRHVLLMGERAGSFGEASVKIFLDKLRTVDLRVAPLPEEQSLLELARRHRLSVYDAAYLKLAARTGSGLASLDARLNRAAVAEGVSLFAARG